MSDGFKLEDCDTYLAISKRYVLNGEEKKAGAKLHKYEKDSGAFIGEHMLELMTVQAKDAINRWIAKRQSETV